MLFLPSRGSLSPTSALGLFLCTAPSIVTSIVFLTPLATVAQIQHDQSTKSLPYLPFISQLLNCFVWTGYALLRADATMLVPNVVGLLLAVHYCFVFATHFAGGLRSELARWHACAGGFVVVTGTVVLLSSRLRAEAVLSTLGVGSAVVFMASPLSSIFTVLRDKSTRSMPFPTSATLFASAALWVGYGWLVADDFSIWFPNLLGLAAGAAQLALHLRFSGARGGLQAVAAAAAVVAPGKSCPAELA